MANDPATDKDKNIDWCDTAGLQAEFHLFIGEKGILLPEQSGFCAADTRNAATAMISDASKLEVNVQPDGDPSAGTCALRNVSYDSKLVDESPRTDPSLLEIDAVQEYLHKKSTYCLRGGSSNKILTLTKKAFSLKRSDWSGLKTSGNSTQNNIQATHFSSTYCQKQTPHGCRSHN